MSKLKTILSIVIILTVLCLLLFSLKTKQTKQSPPTTSIASQELSQKEYLSVRDELIQILSDQNPRIALTTLREKITSNEKIARSCHDLVHELGHKAYEKYGDFGQAMQYQDEICNSGYLHGIIESHFSQSNDIFATIRTVCQQYNPESFIGWECLHGVGHGLMYFTENDLPKSLSLCSSFTDTFSPKACINGVFMENFNVDQKLHVSKYLKENEPLYPCAKQKLDYKADCYLYAPTYFLSLHKNQYLDALSLCKTAEKKFQLICVSGVGSQAIKENINNAKFVETVCMHGSREETNACVTGMIGLYINHFGRLTEAKLLCGKLEKTNQTTCQEVIASQEALF